MPKMPEYRYDPRHALGTTYLQQAHWQKRGRHDSLAGDIGERIIYYTLVGTAAILTLASATRIARKITK